MENNKKKKNNEIKDNPFKSSNASNNKKDYTKEQRDKDITKLNEQLSKNTSDGWNKAGGIVKRILIILLIVVLLAGIALAIFFLAKGSADITGGGVIKLSTLVTENLEDISPDDQGIRNALIYPGDKFSVKCEIRNADKIAGDSPENATTYNKIFVRYSIALQVGDKKYNNTILPVLSNLRKKDFHFYNKDEEIESYNWDGYYYYYGVLNGNQSLTLFEEICFDFHNVTNDFGGKNAKIIVTVEAVHADIDVLGVEGGDAWNTAPRKWINNMKKGINNDGETIIL